MPLSKKNLTQMLQNISNGDHKEVDELFSAVNQELRRIAGARMRSERPNHTIQPTALVHEAYIRLVNQADVSWQNRAHFLAVAAKVMRQFLIDYAREQGAVKRGGGQKKLALDEALTQGEERDIDLVILGDALTKFEKIDPKRSRLVELRFFGGLTNYEIAEVIGVSDRTVKRDLRTALAWLRHEIGESR
jgi:RNA polymerase sigma factor (TIGR02999 family)